MQRYERQKGIRIPEYSVKSTIDDVVMRHLIVLPFNHDHAIKTGQFVAIRKTMQDDESGLCSHTGTVCDIKKTHVSVKDDMKLFAQAHEANIPLLATDDQRMSTFVEFFNSQGYTQFRILPLWEPFNQIMASTGEHGECQTHIDFS